MLGYQVKSMRNSAWMLGLFRWPRIAGGLPRLLPEHHGLRVYQPVPAQVPSSTPSKSSASATICCVHTLFGFQLGLPWMQAAQPAIGFSQHG